MTKEEQNKLITHCAAIRLTIEMMLIEIEAVEQEIIHSSKALRSP